MKVLQGRHEDRTACVIEELHSPICHPRTAVRQSRADRSVSVHLNVISREALKRIVTNDLPPSDDPWQGCAVKTCRVRA